METLVCKSFPKGIEPREIKVIDGSFYYPSFLLTPCNKGLFSKFILESKVVINHISYYLIDKYLKKGVDYIN